MVATSEAYASAARDSFPYVVFRHFKNVVARSQPFSEVERIGPSNLADQTVPEQEAKNVCRALQFFGLIDEQGRPSLLLTELKAPDHEFPKLCERLDNEHYAWVEIPKDGTVEIAFIQDQFQAKGSKSAQKQAAFFCKLRKAHDPAFQPMRRRSGKESGRSSREKGTESEAEHLNRIREAAVQAFELVASTLDVPEHWTAAYNATLDGVKRAYPNAMLDSFEALLGSEASAERGTVP